MKFKLKTILQIMLVLPPFIISSGCGDTPNYPEEDGNGGGNNSGISAPKKLTATSTSSSIELSWNSVYEADGYGIYRATSKYGDYSYLDFTYSNMYSDWNVSSNTTYYYKVSSFDVDGHESGYSNIVSCSLGSSGGSGGEDGGGSGGEGGGGSGGGTSAPSTPTGLSATVGGSTVLPYVELSWNSVDNADTYNIYRSSSSSGSYTKIGSAYYNSSYDDSPKDGKNYYRVTAVNSKGESSKSDYAVAEIDRNAVAPCPPTIKLSGKTTYLTVKWTASTSSGCGKPTSYRVYMRDSDGTYLPVSSEMSGTSYTLDASIGVLDATGYVRIAVEAKNANGSDYGYAIWDSQNNKQYY